MLKTICTIFIISTFAVLSEANPLFQNNGTNSILLGDSQVSEMRAEQERHVKSMDDELDKTMEIQHRAQKLLDGLFNGSEIQYLRAELERQSKFIEGLLNPHNCDNAKSNGINEILVPKFSKQPFKIACDVETRGGGWIVILRRMDGSVNFYRNWTEYQNGFGDLDGEFFLGLDKIHAITADKRQELLVIVEDFETDERLETYDDFAIGNNVEQYVLSLGKARGTAGDSLTRQKGMKFSTFDRDNDIDAANCAERFTGAWWYEKCHDSQLTGKYNDPTWGKGVNWDSFRGPNYSLKKAVMMIRPRY
ncbi:microfibril-associated glycoprotein 4-like [Drosophila innubila]|uniref:microfibril-associated glycoprotein 4-like n=1 Tax=Drosophila innubila TaxID=198719 RepID=UPI00148E2DBE|nr:microfibril-associated glycoprotein 4-like [Drosophila innubila]